MTAVLPDSATSRFPASDQITVRMLLNHTSGIPEWLTDEAAAEIATNPTRVRTVDEYLRLAAERAILPAREGVNLLEHGL